MTSVFIFSLIVGGGLLALSILGDLAGGGDADFDSDFDADFDADFDVDVDADFDFDADADLAVDDLDVDAAVDGEMPTDLAGAIRIFTIRNLTYFMFGFGGVGWLLVTLQPGTPIWLATVAALFGGILAGGTSAVVFGWLKATDSGWQADEASFVGCRGRVILPVGHGKLGQIMVQRGDREHELRALPFDAGADAPESWSRVVVIEMEDGTARVAPADLLGPADDDPNDS